MWITSSLQALIPERATPEAKQAVEELLPSGPERRRFAIRFCALISLSSSIAAFGLLSDSSAVVIGAMLVAPLMTPILAADAAVVQAKNRDLLAPVGFVAMGTILAIFVGYAMSLLAADASTVVGITLEYGANEEAANALVLYLTKLAAIVFAASVMLVEAGFRPHLENTRQTFRVRLFITIGTVITVAIPPTMHTRSALANRQLRSDVSTAVADWDARARISELRTSIDDGTAVVSVLVAGPGSREEVWRLAQASQDDVDRPLELELRYSQVLEFRVDVE